MESRKRSRISSIRRVERSSVPDGNHFVSAEKPFRIGGENPLAVGIYRSFGGSVWGVGDYDPYLVVSKRNAGESKKVAGSCLTRRLEPAGQRAA